MRKLMANDGTENKLRGSEMKQCLNHDSKIKGLAGFAMASSGLPWQSGRLLYFYEKLDFLTPPKSGKVRNFCLRLYFVNKISKTQVF
jgi:hypothetical protein